LKSIATTQTFAQHLGKAFLTTLALMVVEMFLMALIMILVQIICCGNNSGIAGVNPFISILSGSAFVFLMRFILGFSLANTILWLIISLSNRRIPIWAACLMNCLSILVMYAVWDKQYEIFHSLFYIKDWEDLFGSYQTALMCAVMSPLVVGKMKFFPNSLPIILREKISA
jgi:hypothetical protein